MRTNAGGADEAAPAMGGPARTAAWPQNFLWGVATAGYQVEGGITNNDWNIFTTSPSIVSRVHNIGFLAGEGIDLIPPGEAVRQGDLATLREDLDRAALLGLNAYRFSVEWSRVEPTLGSNSIKVTWSGETLTISARIPHPQTKKYHQVALTAQVSRELMSGAIVATDGYPGLTPGATWQASRLDDGVPF
jgi:hypothetical protein